MANPIKMTCLKCGRLSDGFREELFKPPDVLTRRITYMHVQPDGSIEEHIIEWKRLKPGELPVPLPPEKS